MTDIRKDFENKARKHGLRCIPSDGVCSVDNFYDTPISNAAFWGFQAGRAHYVDGLISEIEKCEAENADNLNSYGAFALCIQIIRKPFGK